MRFVNVGLGIQNGAGWNVGNTATANIRQALLSQYQRKQSVYGANQDTLSLSTTGRQLSLVMNSKDSNGESLFAEMIGNSWGSVAGRSSNKEAKWMDKYISQSGIKLDQMKALAKAAQSESLSDYDRLLLQMEMGSLQHELNVYSNVLSTVKGIAGQAGVKNPEVAAETLARNQLGKYEETDAYKMLARALGRVANGEAWDVAEIVHPIIKPNDHSDPTILGDVIVVGEEWVVTQDKNIPTVGEILKGRGRSLMDVDAASVTAAELEGNTQDLKVQREDLAVLAENMQESDSGTGDLSSIGILWGRTTRLLDSIFRDAVHTSIGEAKSEEGYFVKALMGDAAGNRLSKNPSQLRASLQNKE